MMGIFHRFQDNYDLTNRKNAYIISGVKPLSLNNALYDWQIRDTVYNACVENNYFTNGDNPQYEEMFDLLEHGAYKQAFFMIAVCSVIKDGETVLSVTDREEVIVKTILKKLGEVAKGNVGK